MPERLTPAQFRAARAMLDWSLVDLANAARVSVSAVKRADDGVTASTSLAMRKRIEDALETAGIRFLPDEGDGPGLRLRPREVSPIARFF